MWKNKPPFRLCLNRAAADESLGNRVRRSIQERAGGCEICEWILKDISGFGESKSNTIWDSAVVWNP
jgi:hypothetical protein